MHTRLPCSQTAPVMRYTITSQVHAAQGSSSSYIITSQEHAAQGSSSYKAPPPPHTLLNTDLKGFAVEKKSRSISSHQPEQFVSTDWRTASPHLGTAIPVHFKGHTELTGGVKSVKPIEGMLPIESVGGVLLIESVGWVLLIESVGGVLLIESVGGVTFILLGGGPVVPCFGELPWLPSSSPCLLAKLMAPPLRNAGSSKEPSLQAVPTVTTCSGTVRAFSRCAGATYRSSLI